MTSEWRQPDYWMPPAITYTPNPNYYPVLVDQPEPRAVRESVWNELERTEKAIDAVLADFKITRHGASEDDASDWLQMRLADVLTARPKAR